MHQFKEWILLKLQGVWFTELGWGEKHCISVISNSLLRGFLAMLFGVLKYWQKVSRGLSSPMPSSFRRKPQLGGGGRGPISYLSGESASPGYKVEHDSDVSKLPHLIPLATDWLGLEVGCHINQYEPQDLCLSQQKGAFSSQWTWAWRGVRLELLRAVGSSKDLGPPETKWMGMAWKWSPHDRGRTNRWKLVEPLNQAMAKTKIPGFGNMGAIFFLFFFTLV